MNELSLLAARFQGVLLEAQGAHGSRNDIVTGPDGQPELEWFGLVREEMHSEVNRVRAEAGHSEIPLSLIERADRQASGHSDYASKFALYCAELALNVPRVQY